MEGPYAVKVRPVYGRINPSPKKKIEETIRVGDDDLQQILDSIINEEYLKRLTGQQDLSKTTHLEISVNTAYQSLLDLSELLPNLNALTLDNSTISSVRDLGIGLKDLTYLSLNNCGLSDLDGIGVLGGLRELSLCDNMITDVAPLAMHENVEVVHLSGNMLSDISIADALSSCPKLRSLFLSRNPIERAPRYRLVMASLIPGLQMLDGSAVDPSAQTKVTHGMVLEAASAMHLVEEELDDERRLEMCIMQSEPTQPEPMYYQPPAVAAYGLTSASIEELQRPGTSYGAAARLASSGSNPLSSSLEPDTGSELTHGSAVVLAGNMAAAMRKRRNEKEKTALCSIEDSNSPRLGGSSKNFNRDVDTMDGDSALAVLDSVVAMEKNTSNSNRRSASTNSAGSKQSEDDLVSNATFLPEGDVTHVEGLRGNVPLHHLALRAAGSTSADSRFSDDMNSDSKDRDLELREPIGGPEVMSPKLKNRISRDSSADGVRRHSREGQAKDLSQVSSVEGRRSAELRDSTRETSHRKRESKPSFAGATVTDGFADAATSDWESAGEGNGDVSLRRGSNSSNRVAPSPRQLNASRPGTSASTTSSNGSSRPGTAAGNSLGARAPSAPFKVVADCEEMEQVRSRISASVRRQGAGIGDVVGGEGGSSSSATAGIASLPQRKPLFGRGMDRAGDSGSDSDGDGDTEDDASPMRRPWGTATPGGMGKSKAKRNQNKSIVQRDLVKRNFATAEEELLCDIAYDSSGSGDDDEDVDDKAGMLVTHAARYRLMSASSRKRPPVVPPGKLFAAAATNTSSSSSLSVANAAAAVAAASSAAPSRISTGGTAASSGGSSFDARPTSGGSTGRPLSAKGGARFGSGSGSGSGNKESMSAMAGTSLGFDLHSSLAAIDQWVDDMESDDSEDEEEEAETLDSHQGNKQGPGAGASAGLESNHARAEGGGSGGGGQTQSDIMRFNAWGFNNTPRKGYNVESFQSPDGSMGSGSARSKGEELQTGASASHGPSKMKSGSAIKVLSRDAILSMCTSSSASNSEISASDFSLPSSAQIYSLAHNLPPPLEGDRDGEGEVDEDGDDDQGRDLRLKLPHREGRSRNASGTNAGASTGGGVGAKDAQNSSSLTPPRARAAPAANATHRLLQRHPLPPPLSVALSNSAVATVMNAPSVSAPNPSAFSPSRGQQPQPQLQQQSQYGKSKGKSKAGDKDVAINDGPSASFEMFEREREENVPSGAAHRHQSSSSSEHARRSKDFDVLVPTKTTSAIEYEDNTERAASSSASVMAAKSSSASRDDDNVFGDGVFYSDAELVELLSKPPKSVPALRTRSSFQEFFRGMRTARMLALLEKGFADVEDPEERAQKVRKRMELVREVLT